MTENKALLCNSWQSDRFTTLVLSNRLLLALCFGRFAIALGYSLIVTKVLFTFLVNKKKIQWNSNGPTLAVLSFTLSHQMAAMINLIQTGTLTGTRFGLMMGLTFWFVFGFVFFTEHLYVQWKCPPLLFKTRSIVIFVKVKDREEETRLADVKAALKQVHVNCRRVNSLTWLSPGEFRSTWNEIHLARVRLRIHADFQRWRWRSWPR